MRNLLAWLLVLSPLAHADSEVCSSYVERDPKLAKAIEFLGRYAGRYPLGHCTVELHLCSSYLDSEDRGEMVGDLLVIDKRGREFYAPIYFLRENSPRFRYALRTGRILFHYKYKYEDRLNNPQTLGVESIHLEILSHNNGDLKSLELGYDLRKDSTEKGHRHPYQWTICRRDDESED